MRSVRSSLQIALAALAAVGAAAKWLSVPACIAVVSACTMLLAWHIVAPGLLVAGTLGLCYGLWGCWRRWSSAGRSGSSGQTPPGAVRVAHPPPRRRQLDPTDTEGLVRQMLEQGRYALLLRPQLAGHLGPEMFQQALQALAEGMALVPDGEVFLGPSPADLEELHRVSGPAGRIVAVERFFLDRYPVTNRQYYEFVAAGGYQQVGLWDEAIWPAVLDFVDATQQPGPRFWRDGCYLPGEQDHPVVGVSWYEACAYARWVGKRLPTDAEWVKAGSWPVNTGGVCVQRRYPWGDAMDRSKANLWGSGPGRTVPVTDFPEGVSVGGVYQLIGNVWEWTSGWYRAADHPAGPVTPITPLRSIRGGAFDTYFDHHASCQFQSGEDPLQRRHNIGFRCAIAVHDLQLAFDASGDEQCAGREQAAAVEAAL